ncbi:MAG: anti-sigma factor family protein, partial [Steroidobacteraceae bacterium]
MSERLELNDELLCAYLDGEIDADMHARVERALVDDAGARVRLERMRVADQRLKAEIPLPALQPNDPLSARILGSEPVSRIARPSLRWSAAIAALAAGISGVIVGFVLSRSQEAPEAPVVASAQFPSLRGASSNTLVAALDTGESGKTIED